MSAALNFERVVEQVADRAFEERDAAGDRRGLVELDGDLPAGAPLLAGHDPVDELGEVDRLLRFFGAGVGGQLDELAHEVGELPQLDVGLAEQLVALIGVERARPPQEVDVRTERGEGGAQLVTGVHHQSALLLARRPQRVEHAVEARREPADLVLPVDRDRVVEVLRGGDLGGRRGELLDRPDDAAGDQPRERRGHERARQRDQQQARVEGGEHLLVGLDTARDLHRALVGEGGGEHPERVLAHLDVAELRMPAVLRDVAIPRVDRQRGLPGDRRHDRAVGVEDLGDGVGIRQRGPAVRSAVVGVLAAAGEAARIGVHEARGAREEERVGLGTELAARAHVRGVDTTDDDEPERHGDDERQPQAQAHAARSV